MGKIAQQGPEPRLWTCLAIWDSTPDAWPSNGTWKFCRGRNGPKPKSQPETASKSCNLSAAVRGRSSEFRFLRADAPSFASSSRGRHGELLKRAAGTARARPRECRSFRAGELFPDCSKANEFSLRRVFSESARKIRNPARPPRSPAFHLLPPCPSRRPAVRKPAVCSSARCRGLLAEDRAEFPRSSGRLFSATIRAARGSRSGARQERPRSGTASARAPAERSFRSVFREPARPLLPESRVL